MATKSLATALQTRCPLCRSFTLSTLAGGNQYTHHATLTALQNSANNNCDLCKLIWDCLTSTMREEILAASLARKHQQIVVQPNHLNMKLMPELGSHSAFDGLWVVCGDEEADQSEAGIWGQIELFTTRQNPLSKWFTGRDIPRDPSSEENFQDIKGWLEECRRHPACKRGNESPLPKHVLDVGTTQSPSLRLAMTEGQLGSYLALSYCWGMSATVTTTYDSLKDHLRGIDIAQLPATIVDAIQITRKLGFKYLWVDAFCILQPRFRGDPEAIADWQEQSSKMADIYGNAFLTIAAGAAADKHDGCFIFRTDHPLTCEIALDGTRRQTGIYARRPVNANKKFSDRSPLEKRAWTFQEASLSQRLLLYDKFQISMLCKEADFFGRGATTTAQDRKGTLRTTRGPQLFSSQGIGMSQNEQQNREGIAYRMLENWYSSLEFNFCGRSLTNDSDMLPALSGVAHRVQPDIGGSYRAGIWEVDLIRGLLWKTQRILPQGKDKFLTHPATYRAPSWSWASVNGEIYYGIGPNQTKRWIKEKDSISTKVLEVSTTLVGPAFDPMGLVSGGFLKINALLKEALLIPRGENEFMSQWTDSKGVVYKHLPGDAWDFLVGAETVNTSKAEAVGALGAFDTEDRRPGHVFCILLTRNEGLVLGRVNEGSDEFVRVGMFKLQDISWFEGCRTKDVTII